MVLIRRQPPSPVMVVYGMEAREGERNSVGVQRSNTSAFRTCLEHGERWGNEQRPVIFIFIFIVLTLQKKKLKQNCAENNISLLFVSNEK